MFYFAGHVPFPCWDLNGVMLLRAQRPEESAFFSVRIGEDEVSNSFSYQAWQVRRQPTLSTNSYT